MNELDQQAVYPAPKVEVATVDLVPAADGSSWRGYTALSANEQGQSPQDKGSLRAGDR